MRIMLVNKFHYFKGGSETYYFELGKLLKNNGQAVAYFSMNNKKNIKTDCKEYFVSEIDLNNSSKLKALDVIYSRENYKKMCEAIADFKPDIVHINNFQRQLSSSIIKACNDNRVPIVFTMHDLQAICPAISMLDNTNSICEECITGKYLNCVKKKCVKNSRMKSILGALEAKYYKINKIYSDKIDYIIAPSKFYKEQLVSDGISSNKIEVIPNFINTNLYDNRSNIGEYALYFGRLSNEKGINNLLEAFSNLSIGKLYIAGEGIEKSNIEKFIKLRKLNKKVKLLGMLSKDEMLEVLKKCRFVVIPSIWYENCPYSIIESLAVGKPVVGSNIAGIKELIVDNQNGFCYQYDNINELKDKMELLFKDDKLVNRLGNTAKKMAQELYAPTVYYKKILEIYTKVLKEKN